MGNFLSEPHGIQSAVVLKDCFKILADLIAEFPSILHSSKFVIVPGPSDPGFVNILPRYEAFAVEISSLIS
jgi:DNA polymerase epsilon subunit 2